MSQEMYEWSSSCCTCKTCKIFALQIISCWKTCEKTFYWIVLKVEHLQPTLGHMYYQPRWRSHESKKSKLGFMEKVFLLIGLFLLMRIWIPIKFQNQMHSTSFMFLFFHLIFFHSPPCKHLQSCPRQWKFYPTIPELHKTPPFAPSSKNQKKNCIFPKKLYKVMPALQAHHKIRILCEDFGNIFSCQKK
jgi:hypothetical protein